MSEEEIKDNLIMLKYFLQEEGDENWQDYCDAIQGLLDLYEKEKNKKLEENKKFLEKQEIEYIRDRTEDEVNFKWEYKIKAKIEFIKNLREKFYYEENVISILQELLEESDN